MRPEFTRNARDDLKIIKNTYGPSVAQSILIALNRHIAELHAAGMPYEKRRIRLENVDDDHVWFADIDHTALFNHRYAITAVAEASTLL